MPIMAAQGRRDARDAARLLAIAARDCIRNPALAPDREITLNNVYRLLEAYRANAFFGLEPLTKQPSGAKETLSLMPPDERYVKEVRDVLERAIETAFTQQTKDQAIEAIEKVLRGITYPQDFERPTKGDLTKATRFFEVVLQNLRLA